jgi:hypothetical protein
MRCSEFRDQHCAFVDDTLAGVELIRMQGHITGCPECAAQDTKVRRSLMLAHSIPHIAPSPGFSGRLEERLRACKEKPDSVACAEAYAHFQAVATIGVVASLLMLGYVANALYRTGMPSRDIVLPPVVAMADPPQPDVILTRLSPPLSSPTAIMVSAPAGIHIWPTTAFAEQTPLQFVRYQQVH